MRSRRGTIVMIVVGVVICVFIVGAGSAVWFFASAFDSVSADDASASREFEVVRQRLGSEPPVITIRDREAVLNRRAPDGAAPRELQRLQVLTWDPDDETLSRLTLPWWLIRVKAGSFDVSMSADGETTRLPVSSEDIERYGPALLIEHDEPGGSRVLVWTE